MCQFAASGSVRGRAFEAAFYQLCTEDRLNLLERAGSRTLCNVRSASGLGHESDAVISGCDLLIHIELKHLTVEVSKCALMEFNQKGLDFLLTGDLQLQRRPLYRMLISGGALSREARRFAALWGIVIMEPSVLPLPVLHWLAGSTFSAQGNERDGDRIWREAPIGIGSLQEKLRRLPLCLADRGSVIRPYHMNVLLGEIQQDAGDRYWRALDNADPHWLERIYRQTRVGRR
jgi:hypothetical protein